MGPQDNPNPAPAADPNTVPQAPATDGGVTPQPVEAPAADPAVQTPTGDTGEVAPEGTPAPADQGTGQPV